MKKTKWILSFDDFDDGKGEQEYPHCPNCGRGVYKRDAGNYCPFCGAYMNINKKLTDRQVELIERLIWTYENFARLANIPKRETKKFVFNAIDYYIWKKDYKEICEIIDYIKGVKK